MKTIEIKLDKKLYKDIKERAKAYGISPDRYIMMIYREEAKEDYKKLYLDDMIDQNIFECDNEEDIDETAEEIICIVQNKVYEAKEYLEKNEEKK